MSVRYFKHKEKNEVICELFEAVSKIRISKWKWSGNFCTEEHNYKDTTPEFFNTFNEITHKEFNEIWGDNLMKA